MPRGFRMQFMCRDRTWGASNIGSAKTALLAFASLRMLALLTAADVYAPEPLGLVNLLIGGGRILWIGRDLPQLSPELNVRGSGSRHPDANQLLVGTRRQDLAGEDEIYLQQQFRARQVPTFLPRFVPGSATTDCQSSTRCRYW